MTPGARISAAIEVLDQILAGQPAEQALLRWSRSSRYAGSGDRAAVRDLVFDALRCRNSHAALGGALTGRGLMIGGLCAAGQDPALLFTGQGHAPAPLVAGEGAGSAEGVSNLPDWIRPLWDQSLGDSAQAVAAAMQHRAPVWLRVNGIKADAAEAIRVLAGDRVDAMPDPRLATALLVTGNERRLSQSRAYRDGLVELQDLSPQLACATLPVAPGMRVLDYCAGGGGKTLAVAGRSDRLTLVAHDADPARMRDLPQRAARAGVKVRLAPDPAGVFDLVIADVPCSGSGTWRRTPDSKWRLTEKALLDLVALQAWILRKATAHVRPGGHLAYMTCSVLDPENDAQAAAFLAENPDFRQVSRHLWTPLDASDGFFLALLARR
ncbi:RsmB/NOP family class I SAM-dependent RNA methyltransferase [Paracoccus benzoatiresistens]|uniref:RsmB/NOP family class I SAM-dependent RNA methyltransferase n=1 Tax=Paracoccus benzoatiresistens TaxID=2997341 RepID=A0ABT4J541_9RHOB|nr:RsmB/NOP family class I SAM-dependent RNA methyltransferase [Paracoccus sp. EF6]MCZ0961541.1 RsmB/NOP family class I SAM-dependent RNA methyltransferase [Paracoccus sp. EF6]